MLISSQPTTCEVSASRISQPDTRAIQEVRSACPMIRPITTATTVAVNVASNSGPATRRRSAPPRRSSSREARHRRYRRRVRTRPRAPGSDRTRRSKRSRDQAARRSARSAAPRARGALGRSRQIAHATSGTSTTWMLATTVARPAPDVLDRGVPRGSGQRRTARPRPRDRRSAQERLTEPPILEPRHEPEHGQRERAPEDRRRRRRGVAQLHEDAGERDRQRPEQRAYPDGP